MDTSFDADPPWKEAPVEKPTGNQQGLSMQTDPTAEGEVHMPAQQQAWPGKDSAMHPAADHGEKTYQGANKLAGKKAVITGGDSGIGRAIAIAFAREGADVAIVYLNEHQDAQETLKWVKEAGREGQLISGDLTNRDHCREVIRQVVEEFGTIDILVNNAGVHFEIEDLDDLTPENVERTYRTNVYAPLWLTQAAVPHMEAGATIINTGSVQGFAPSPSLLDYASTKAAIHNLTKSLAQLLAERGIRVNCVAPGPVWTPLIVSTRPPEKVEGFGADSLWKRPAQPAELAPSYVFLASADSRYYTGEILSPTGLPDTSR
jgi:NAD(P)-dependent dehydrogenase (short-subunit alcohol dehydrogenase family)